MQLSLEALAKEKEVPLHTPHPRAPNYVLWADKNGKRSWREKDSIKSWPTEEKKCHAENQNAPSATARDHIEKIAAVLKEAASHFNLDETSGIIRAQRQEIEGHKKHIHRLTQAIKDLEKPCKWESYHPE